MAIRQRLQKFNRALKSFLNDIAFGQDIPIPIGTTGRMAILPGTTIDWQSQAGELYTFPAAQAGMNWMWRNAPQAPPMVEAQDAKGNWNEVPNHPLTLLLKNPNPAYNGDVLLQGILYSLMDIGDRGGNAFVGIRWENGPELWWLPHTCIKAKRNKGSNRLIDFYEYRLGTRTQIIPVEEMLHIRFGLDPRDPRYGLSPMASATRPGATLQRAANYAANVMRNAGAMGGLATPDGDNVTFNPAAFVELWDAKHQGDGIGKMAAYDIPIKLQYPANSPQDLTLETLPDRPEADCSALNGVPSPVAGLHVGRLSKTFANLHEAREAAWEEGLYPMLCLIASQEGAKLLSIIGRSNIRERVAYDIRKVRPLQPDKDALHLRTRQDFIAGMIDRATAKTMVDYPILPEDAGVYYARQVATPDQMPPVSKPVKSSHNGTRKAEPPTDWLARILSEEAALVTADAEG